MAGSEIQQTIYNMEKEKMRKRTLIIGILSFIILLLAGVGFWAYCLILAPDFEPRKTVYVYIDEKKDFDDLCRQLVDSAGCQRIGSFKQLAGMLKYPTNMRTGRYAVEPGM
ncbi:aminodeoxychorismate lyase, partial [Parabacteroides distasonis]|nr:aminodeoxychorismate lyase [Parabacteroides distasonis]